uniref:Uncharacterized protein n=1 Tax=Rhizophora mucronata TaxID=61149 RepID=A0A2P2QDP4_RHIMU
MSLVPPYGHIQLEASPPNYQQNCTFPILYENPSSSSLISTSAAFYHSISSNIFH